MILISTKVRCQAGHTLSHFVLLKVLTGKYGYAHATVKKSYHQDILCNLSVPGLYLLIFTYLTSFHEACEMVLNDGG